MPLLEPSALRARVTSLAEIQRGSATEGERVAAHRIALELRRLGASVEVESERAHGGYWWPIGLMVGAAGLAGLSRGRGLPALVGALAALGVRDDITGGRQWFRRRLPQRETVNVVAELGPREAERRVVFVAHHDAAHTGLVFHPAVPRAIARRFPRLWERTNTTPGTMWGAFGGPAAVCLGALLGAGRLRLAGMTVCAGYAAAMADIGRPRVVPGANDNLSGVAVLLSLAHALASGTPRASVMLVSTGSEESFMEGMQAFARRHFPRLDPNRTTFICLDTVGSERLMVLEGEGMLGIHEYPKDLIALFGECAEQLGIELVPNLRFRNATDGLIALRAGYPCAMLGSVDHHKIPSNYHWPTDTAENVDYGSVADAARLCLAVLDRLSPAAPA